MSNKKIGKRRKFHIKMKTSSKNWAIEKTNSGIIENRSSDIINEEERK